MFAPTVRLTTLCALLSVAAQKDAKIHQADIKNAYLQADLHETLYMELLPMYEDFREVPDRLKGKKVCCKLHKPLYGSKQGAHEWYQKLKRVFLTLGYTICQADEAVFYKFSKDKYTIVAATDDFTIIADSKEAITLIKKQLREHFEMTDLSKIKWLLGISVQHDRKARTITLGQHAYVDSIIEWAGQSKAREVITPMEPGINLSYDSPLVSTTILPKAQHFLCCETISCLMYASLAT